MDELMSRRPCPRCLDAYNGGAIRAEAVMPLPSGAEAPLGLDGKPCCHDCAAADTLIKLKIIPPGGGSSMNRDDFLMARTCTGSDRQEQFRLPGIPMGLVGYGIMRPSNPGDMERHWEWMDAWKVGERQ